MRINPTMVNQHIKTKNTNPNLVITFGVGNIFTGPSFHERRWLVVLQLPDGVIKDSDEYMGYFYALLINKSLLTETIPEGWKISSIVPVKIVKKTVKAEELKPINTLPSMEKMLETNKILITEQSGGRAKHSCETALNLVLSQWEEDFSCHLNVVAVFIDLKRAFEIIDGDLMLEKLKRIGVKH